MSASPVFNRINSATATSQPFSSPSRLHANPPVDLIRASSSAQLRGVRRVALASAVGLDYHRDNIGGAPPFLGIASIDFGVMAGRWTVPEAGRQGMRTDRIAGKFGLFAVFALIGLGSAPGPASAEPAQVAPAAAIQATEVQATEMQPTPYTVAQADAVPVASPVSYSSDQADRGKDRYESACLECHGDDLKGGMNGGAPLRGVNFEMKYANGAPASALYLFTSTLMPPNSPGRYSANAYADLVAYILKRNGFRAGAPLPSDVDALDYLIVEK